MWRLLRAKSQDALQAYTRIGLCAKDRAFLYTESVFHNDLLSGERFCFTRVDDRTVIGNADTGVMGVVPCQY